MANTFNMADIAVVDKQIETLLSCKPLPESEVRALAEKVSLLIPQNQLFYRPRKFSSMRAMSPRFVPQSPSAVTFMASSTILKNFSRLVASPQTLTTSLWVIMLTVDTTLLRP